MNTIKIKYPSKISINKIKQYFKKYNLSFLFDYVDDQKKGVNDMISSKLYGSDINDLYRLHEFILINKRTTILEFGCGWSSLVMLNALLLNQKKYLDKINNLRINEPFKIFTVDNEKKFLNIAKKRTVNFFGKKSKNVSFIYSECIMTNFNGRYATKYNKIPSINPDFIYLDGPDQFNIKGSINGFNVRHKDLMPMSCDILQIEHFLRPGTIIVSDGRSANIRFLLSNFQRKWSCINDNINDQHILVLNENPLGVYSREQLQFYKK